MVILVQFKTSTVQSVQFKTTVRYNQYNSRQQYGTISTIQDNSTVQSVQFKTTVRYNQYNSRQQYSTISKFAQQFNI